GGATVAITGLAIVHGRADQGGGILNESGASLSVSRCLFTADQADGGSFGTGFGGGILNEGTLTVRASTFTANTSTGGGGGFGSGGGIANFGTSISISHSTFTGDLAID